jgi:hypothetical protein
MRLRLFRFWLFADLLNESLFNASGRTYSMGGAPAMVTPLSFYLLCRHDLPDMQKAEREN